MMVNWTEISKWGFKRKSNRSSPSETMPFYLYFPIFSPSSSERGKDKFEDNATILWTADWMIFFTKGSHNIPFCPTSLQFFFKVAPLTAFFLHAIQYSLDKLSVHIFWLARLCVWPLDGYRLAAEEKFIDWCVTLFCTISSRYCFTDTAPGFFCSR